MNIEALSDDTAVQALSRIAKEWLTNRGVEAYVVVEGAKRKAQISYRHLPDWIAGIAKGTQAAGELARLMLGALLEAEDEEVATWTKQVINEASVPKAQVDPITLSILGAILIGSI